MLPAIGNATKNSRFFAFLAFPDEPSAGIGVVEVQKLEAFCVFCLRVGLWQLSRGLLRPWRKRDYVLLALKRLCDE